MLGGRRLRDVGQLGGLRPVHHLAGIPEMAGMLRVGQARELFRGDFWVDPSGDQTFDVGPDGNFLVIQGDDLVDVRVVTGLTGAIEDDDGR